MPATAIKHKPLSDALQRIEETLAAKRKHPARAAPMTQLSLDADDDAVMLRSRGITAHPQG